jgi:hypothetical protein
MLNGGISLDSQAAWDAWPEQLPLLVWHGAADPICDPVAAKRFGENAAAKDKQVEMFDVSPLLFAIRRARPSFSKEGMLMIGIVPRSPQRVGTRSY